MRSKAGAAGWCNQKPAGDDTVHPERQHQHVMSCTVTKSGSEEATGPETLTVVEISAISWSPGEIGDDAINI